MINTDANSNTKITSPACLNMPNTIQETEYEQNDLPQRNSSHLTTHSNETDFTQLTTTNSSIKTMFIPTSSSSISSDRHKEGIRRQYDQKPEKIPDVAAEMEKWFAITD
ncbi:uncharacterized protein BX663DRAFT_526442, partial [Cokeromyces recurvatus]|uniref:uncharacterized protein n=1 Tax=Cokeromyces recurvatus TaxID=90255 RepID=UPI0022201F63